MNHIIGLRCTICGELYQPEDVLYVCPKHGNDGTLDVEYDYDVIRMRLEKQHSEGGKDKSFTMFNYRPFLPIAEETVAPPLPVGGTPLFSVPRIATQLGIEQLWLKDDGRNPTASLKDRASAIAIMKAQELGAEIVTTASTGNAAAALAGIAASVGQKTVIFVPASAPPAKITQLLVYGATVLLVNGTYDDAFELCLQATEKFGWYCRNTGYNPYMAEGKKTVTFEMYDQINGQLSIVNYQLSTDENQLPTHIFVSVGDGCIISGVYKGLRDLVGVGLLAKMPKLMGVQAKGSSYLYDAWQNSEDIITKSPVSTNTIADSISAGLPRDRIKALTAVTQTNGAFIQVNDAQIIAAIPELAQLSGVFAEPAAAAAYAGLVQARQDGMLSTDARVLLLITGNGLKDVGSAMNSVGQAVTVEPDLTAVSNALQKMKLTIDS